MIRRILLVVVFAGIGALIGIMLAMQVIVRMVPRTAGTTTPEVTETSSLHVVQGTGMQESTYNPQPAGLNQ